LGISDNISQGKLIIQGGFVAKMGAHESKASNLLKLNCKINNKIVGCFLDLRSTNSFMTLKQWNIRIKIELMVNPITMQLAQGIARPPLSVALGVRLF